MDTRFASTPKDSGFRSFAEFYPFYLTEHRNPVSRALHYIGTWCAVACLVFLGLSGQMEWLIGALVCGYAFS